MNGGQIIAIIVIAAMFYYFIEDWNEKSKR